MKTQIRIAVASPDQRWENKAENRKLCEALVCQAAKKKAEWVVFPEMTLTGFSMNTSLIAERKESSETLSFFSSLAKEYGLCIVFGVVWKHGVKATNNLVCLNKNGRVIADYAKIHPFSYASETKFYEKGGHLALCKVGGVCFGFSICYDLRFPEVFSALAPQAHVLVNIANWPSKRIEHWYALLKARAIENQCYVVGSNRTGIDGHGVSYKKSSAVFSAQGQKLASVSSEKKLDVFVLDMKEQKIFRSEYLFLNDRQPALYRRLFR